MPITKSESSLLRYVGLVLLIIGLFYAIDARDASRADQQRERGYINRAVACYTIVDDVTPEYPLPPDCGDAPVARILRSYGVPASELP